MKIWSWQQAILRSGLRSTTKLLLLTLATYMNQHGKGCYPSIPTLEGDTSLSRRAILDHLNIAIDAGYLVRLKRNVKGQEWASNEYHAALPEGLENTENAGGAPLNQEVQEVHPSEGDDGARGAGDAPEGCSTCTQGVQEVHPNYPVNYPEELSNTTPLPPVGGQQGGGGIGFGKLSAKIQEIISAPFPLNTSIVHSWLALGADAELDILATIRCEVERQRVKKPDWCPSSLKYFTNPVKQSLADRTVVHELPAPRRNIKQDIQQQQETTKGALDAVFGQSHEA